MPDGLQRSLSGRVWQGPVAASREAAAPAAGDSPVAYAPAPARPRAEPPNRPSLHFGDTSSGTAYRIDLPAYR
eukprot:SAG31_NODE_4259_length_3410_cov_2.021444_4_plen_73_part_00